MTEIVEEYHSSPLGRIIYLIGGVISLLLALRFIFILFGLTGTFVDWVYRYTQFLVTPFYSFFGSGFLGVPHIEVASLVAIVVVAIVAGVLASVFRLLNL